MEELNTGTDKKQLLKAVIGFNLGAAVAGVGIVWSIMNNCFKKYAIHNIILLGIIWTITFMVFNSYMPWAENQGSLRPIGWFVCFIFWESVVPLPILFIYNGILGNLWAWKSGKYKTLEEFKKAQKKWNLVGLGGIGIIILGTSLMMVETNMETKANNKKQLNIARAKCRIANETIKPVFNRLGSNFTPDDFAHEWQKNYRVTSTWNRSEHGKINIEADADNKLDTKHGGSSRLDLRIVKSSDCELAKKNCYAYLDPRLYDEVEYTCKFYFDNKGVIVPAKSTLDFINGAK